MTVYPLVQLQAVVVEEAPGLTLVQLSQASCGEVWQVQALVEEGILDPDGDTPADWIFQGETLRTVRIALRLAADLDLSMAGVAVVMSMRREIACLRARLRRAGLND